jgi:hypothetical protein
MFYTHERFLTGIMKLLLAVVIIFMCLSPVNVLGDSKIELSAGETVYVSIYSNIYSGPKEVRHELAVMLSIRNTDPDNPITIMKADYYDTGGKLIDSYVKKPMKLKPLESTYIYLKEYDKRGGPGANFIVKWQSGKKVNQPIIEGLMVSSSRGISFICPGQVITEQSK